MTDEQTITEQLPCGTLQAQTAHAAMQSYAVTADVLLAAQPQPEDWQRLVEAGYRTIVNIRTDPERAAAQQRSAEQVGLTYLYLPVPAYELESKHLAHVAQVLDRVGAEQELGRTVVHCRSGTRVALLWLLYRTVHQGVPLNAARAELAAAGYDDDAMEVFTFCAEDFFERTGVRVA